MSLNHSAIFAKIEELSASDQSASACMGEIISMCSHDVPHTDWPRLAALDYDGDVASLTPWIPRIFASQPAPFPIQGLWIGLCNPCAEDKVWADMYVGSMSEYEPDDEGLNWLSSGQHHYPKDAYANSPSLRTIYEIAYDRAGGLGNNAEWPLCLAFGVFTIRSLLRGHAPQLVASTAARIGVAVGFDSGDMLKLGELTDRGFVPTFKA